jgi:hypothetical protein
MTGSPFERTRSDECLSDLAIDRLVGERETHPHLAACERCASRFAELERDRDRFSANAKPLVSKKRSRVWPAGVGLALAASIALFFVLPDEEGLRTKGGPQIAFYVKHGEKVRRGIDGETVAPKDAIRFAYTTDRAYHLAVFSLDPKGRASVYYPNEAATRSESPGADVALPLSTVLDDSLGRERIWALFCERPIELAAIKSAIESSRSPPKVGGCHARTLDWNKEP